VKMHVGTRTCGDAHVEMPTWGQPPRLSRRAQRGDRARGYSPRSRSLGLHRKHSHLKTAPHACINLSTDQVPANPTPGPTPQPRGPTIIAAGLLLAALAVVVLYTSRRAFLSPVALVVVAAIGVAALLLQRRLRPDLRLSTQSSTPPDSSTRGPLRLNALGVTFAIAAVFADLLHLSPAVMLIAALAAVVCFAISGIIVLKSLRKPRP
jgi:hypothetical protein